MQDKRKRVLVTTVGSWSSKTGSDTMSSLMKEYGAENVAVLYIRADKSDSKSASRYFHIIEGRVMKSIFNHKIETGEEFSPVDLNQDKPSMDLLKEKSIYQFFKKYRFTLFLFARELVWKFGRWKSTGLDDFLRSFKPEVLVCPIESYIHFNTINEYIIRTFHPSKVIGFLWDDNFTYKQSQGLLKMLHRWWLRKGVKRMVNYCDTIFALSPQMKRECDAEFKINSKILSKPIFNAFPFKSYECNKPIRIIYTGNLFVGRDKTLLYIARAFQKLNKDYTKVVLDVYTKSILSKKMYEAITQGGFCRVHSPIPQPEVLKLQSQSDILLFMETLETKSNQEARLSFSTKITDYFSAGRCIWAVGSSTLSSIDYLKSHDAALMCTDKNNIYETLNKLVSNPELIIQYAEKGYFCGKKFHDSRFVLNTLYNEI